MAARITAEVENAAKNYLKVNGLDRTYKLFVAANHSDDFLVKAPGINAYCRNLGVDKESLCLAIALRLSLVHDVLVA